MKKKVYLLTSALFSGLFLISSYSFAKQTGSLNQVAFVPLSRDTIPVTDTTERVFEKVEIEAAYPGGDNAWRRFLEQNINPAVATDNGAPEGTYTVIVQFVVDKEGKVSNIKALTNHGYGMEGEVIRLMKKAPKWSPAVQDGRFVKAYRKQPVTFMVTVEKKKKKRNGR